MNGNKLDHVDEEKDLGVLIDDQLKFHRQTASAIKKAKRVLGLVKKTFAVLDMQILPLLYKTLVRPHLEYGNIIWGPFFKGDILAVERVQRRATKLVSKLKDLSYEERAVMRVGATITESSETERRYDPDVQNNDRGG